MCKGSGRILDSFQPASCLTSHAPSAGPDCATTTTIMREVGNREESSNNTTGKPGSSCSKLGSPQEARIGYDVEDLAITDFARAVRSNKQ
jgi:hypothetical protein